MWPSIRQRSGIERPAEAEIVALSSNHSDGQLAPAAPITAASTPTASGAEKMLGGGGGRGAGGGGGCGSGCSCCFVFFLFFFFFFFFVVFFFFFFSPFFLFYIPLLPV